MSDSAYEEFKEAYAMKVKLENWPHARKSPGEPREHMIEAWRLGIWAYLVRLFPPINRDSTSTGRSTARMILHHAKCIPLATSYSYSVLWPVFQVAVSLDETAIEEKAWVRRYLRRSLEVVGCRHFNNALDLLEKVWENGEMTGLSDMGTFGSGRTIMLG